MADVEIWAVAFYHCKSLLPPDFPAEPPFVWSSLAFRYPHEAGCRRYCLEPPLFDPYRQLEDYKFSSYKSDFRDLQLNEMRFIGLSNRDFSRKLLDVAAESATNWVRESIQDRAPRWAWAMMRDLEERTKNVLGHTVLAGWADAFARCCDAGSSNRYLGFDMRMMREREMLAQYRWWSFPEQRWIDPEELR